MVGFARKAMGFMSKQMGTWSVGLPFWSAYDQLSYLDPYPSCVSPWTEVYEFTEVFLIE